MRALASEPPAVVAAAREGHAVAAREARLRDEMADAAWAAHLEEVGATRAPRSNHNPNSSPKSNPDPNPTLILALPLPLALALALALTLSLTLSLSRSSSPADCTRGRATPSTTRCSI